MKHLRVGMMCRVKDDVWHEWCLRNSKDYYPFKPQPVVALPNNPPYDNMVMLAFPFYWWKEAELEVESE